MVIPQTLTMSLIRCVLLLAVLFPSVLHAQQVLDSPSKRKAVTIELVPTENTRIINGETVYLFEDLQIDPEYVPSDNFWRGVHLIIPDSARSGKYVLYFPYDDKDKVALTVEYDNNKLNGQVLKYYYNGKKKRQTLFKDGLRNGPDFRYNKYGQLLQFETYEKGVLNGPFMSFFHSGHPSVQGNYLNGKLHGEHVTWGLGLDKRYSISEKREYVKGTKK